MLYATTAVSPPSYVVAVAFVLIVATIAAALPALRAARSNPMMTLRDD